MRTPKCKYNHVHENELSTFYNYVQVQFHASMICEWGSEYEENPAQVLLQLPWVG